VRVDESSEFEVSLKYTTASNANKGSYTVNIGNQILEGIVEPTPNENQSKTAPLGRIKLSPGEYELTVKPTDIQGGELMRLFNVSLKPVEPKK